MIDFGENFFFLVKYIQPYLNSAILYAHFTNNNLFIYIKINKKIIILKK